MAARPARTAAGVWGWGGASIDPSNGDAYVATGNVFANPENSFYGDAIVRLTGSLGFVASHSPGFGFGDDDFGSTPVLFQKPGCPPQLLAEQKSGTLYLYDRDSIAGGFRQRVRITTGTSSACPATLPRLRWCTWSILCSYGFFGEGLLAFRLDANCTLQLAWQTASAVGIGSTPTVANGVVYYADGFGPKVHAVNATTGQALWSSGAELPRRRCSPRRSSPMGSCTSPPGTTSCTPTGSRRSRRRRRLVATG